jgi:hypothetical protein
MVETPDKSEILAFLVGVFPFICNMTTVSRTTVNGVVLVSTQVNLVALICGVIVVWSTWKGLQLIKKTPQKDRTRRYGIIALLFLLGAYQILRGIGMMP